MQLHPFFVSAHSSNIQGQILFCGLEKSGQTVGVCGKSLSPVLGAGAVWKGTYPGLCPGITTAHPHWWHPAPPHWWHPAPELSQGAGFGIGDPLRMCRRQWRTKQWWKKGHCPRSQCSAWRWLESSPLIMWSQGHPAVKSQLELGWLGQQFVVFRHVFSGLGQQIQRTKGPLRSWVGPVD